MLTKERKAILIIGSILLVMGGIYRLLPVFESMIPQKEILFAKQQKLAKYRQKAGTLDQKQAVYQAAAARLNRIESSLIKAKTSPLSAVRIQQLLDQFGEKSGVKIKSMRILTGSHKTDAPYDPIPVEVTLLSDIKQLVDMLYEIERSKKLLIIKQLRCRSGYVKKSDKILTTLTIEGFMKKDGA